MPTEVWHRDEVRRLMEAGAQVVDVLPREEYEDQRLPGAVHLPLRRLETDARELLDARRPILVYCWDTA